MPRNPGQYHRTEHFILQIPQNDSSLCSKVTVTSSSSQVITRAIMRLTGLAVKISIIHHRDSKLKYRSICTAHIHYVNKPLMHSWDHLSYRITQYYLPPDRGDSHAFTPAICWVLIHRLWKVERLSWPEHREWTVGSELLRDDITGANCSIITPHWAGGCVNDLPRVATWQRIDQDSNQRPSNH